MYCGVECYPGMFFGIKKLQKYLVGSQKVSNFAPANETEVLPRKRAERSNAGYGAKVQKKVTKILVIHKLVVTLQNLSEKSFRSAGRPGTHEENIERITIDK